MSLARELTFIKSLKKCLIAYIFLEGSTMSGNWRAWFKKLALALGGVTVPCWESMVLAQIIPDETLGAESSVVTPDNINGIESGLAEGEALRVRISGGAVRGSNLFHSFREFNIGEGRGGYFENPAAIAFKTFFSGNLQDDFSVIELML